MHPITSTDSNTLLLGDADKNYLVYSAGHDPIKAGVELDKARGLLSTTSFTRWVETNLPISRAAAYRAIQVAEVYGGRPHVEQ